MRRPTIDDVLTGDMNVRWWLEDDKERLGSQLVQTYRALHERDKPRQEANYFHQRLYGNLPVTKRRRSDETEASKNRITLNVVANVTDFVTNRIGKHKPAPYPITNGGNYSLRRKAKLLRRFLNAQFRVANVYEKTRRMFLDACVQGTGILKVYQDGEKICLDRVLPSEVVVDHHEAMYGEPRQLMQTRHISRDVLRAKFQDNAPSKREKSRVRKVLDHASQFEDFDKPHRWWSDDGVNDQVLVIEAWHLPSSPGAGDGKHVIAVDSGVLYEEAWTEDYFPFVFFRWKPRQEGFWGVGLAEELCGIQVEINLMLQKIQSAYYLMSKPFILRPVGSKIQSSFIDNKIASIIPYSGEKPTVWTPQSFHPEFYQHLERLYAKAYEIAGVSQDSVAPKFYSEESGIARQNRHDIETERFSTVAMDFEEAVLRLSEQLIDRAKELGPDFALPAKDDRGSVQSISWKDVDMEKDKYVLEVRASSFLPTLPSARLDKVIEMVNSGLIQDFQEARELIDYPDLERSDELARAASDEIDRIIELLLDEGIYTPPDPFMDLNLGIQKMRMHRALARQFSDEPELEERIDAMGTWLDQAFALQRKAQIEQQKQTAAAAGAQQAPAPGGTPPAPGPNGAPPTAVQ